MANLIPKIEYGIGPTIIEFDLPPSGYDNEAKDLNINAAVSQAQNGEQQISLNNIEEKFKPKFKLVTKTIVDAIEILLKDHAAFNQSFTYFFDKDVPASAITVKIDKSGLKFKAKRDTASNKYSFSLKFRRVIG